MLRYLTSVSILCASLLQADPICLTEWEAIERALTHNYDLQAQRAVEGEADARRREAWSRWWPSVVMSGETRRTPAVSPTRQPVDTWSAQLGAKQLLFAVDAIYDVMGNRAASEAALYELRAFIHDLVFEVRQAYYNLALAEQEVELQQEVVQLLRAVWESDRDRQEEGTVTGFAVRESQVAAANAMTELFSLRKQMADRQRDLGVLIGMDLCEVERLCVLPDMPLEALPLIQTKLAVMGDREDPLALYQPALFTSGEQEGWLCLMLENRPLLKQGEASVRAAESAVGRERGAYLPRLEAYATHTWRSDNTFGSQFFGGQTEFWETGLSFSWDLFDGFGRAARVRAARAARDQTIAAYEKTIQDATLSLRARFSELEQTLYSLRASEMAADVSDESVELATARREMGAITPLEFRDAVNNRLRTRQDLLQARFNLLTAYYALLRDVGLDREMR